MYQRHQNCRGVFAGSSGGTKTALSVLMEHPSESLLDELNLCKDDKEGRLPAMEAVKVRTMSASLSATRTRESIAAS